MSEHDHILSAIEPGDICGMPADVTLELFGRTWHVRSAMLDGKGGCLLIQPDPVTQVHPAEIADDLMRHVANMLIIGTDWDRKPDPVHVANLGVQLFAHHFGEVYREHMATLAARRKPS